MKRSNVLTAKKGNKNFSWKRIPANKRRQCFAWATLLICGTAIVLFAIFCIQFLGLSIEMEACSEILTYNLDSSGKAASDMQAMRNMMNSLLLQEVWHLPLYAISIVIVALFWDGSSHKFLSSLIGK